MTVKERIENKEANNEFYFSEEVATPGQQQGHISKAHTPVMEWIVFRCKL